MPVESVSVQLRIPFIGQISGNWVPDEAEVLASWEMYVELVTRVAVVEIGPTDGLLREALNSLYSLFGTTREIMRAHGPGVARSRAGSDITFGLLAVAITNGVLRPLLSKWHPLLQEYEARRPNGVARSDHERSWELADSLRAEIDAARQVLTDYSYVLADVCGVPPLIDGFGWNDEPEG